MKAALLIVLSLSALAYAGPAFNKNANTQFAKQQQQQYMTTGNTEQTKAIESLKQWCFSSQMSQTELTGSFKKLVSIIKSAPLDQQTESAVMNERICQGAIVQKSSQSGQTLGQTGADAQAHELIKDVYMDSLIACESRECMQQLLKIINSNQVDQIRASYYMTRLAVTEKKSIKDESEVKQLVESFVSSQQQPASEAVERQKLFAVTSILGKLIKSKQQQQPTGEEITGEHKQLAEQVAKTIVERYIKPCTKQDVEQYQQQPEEQQPELSKKIVKRNVGLKALANIPACVLKSCGSVEQELIKIAEDKQEQSSARQSAIECLEGAEQNESTLKEICFDQQEPIEVRIAAYRALMSASSGKDAATTESNKQQMVEQVVKHCEDQRNQQDDDQFVLYVISHLDNLRTSQQPEQQAIKEIISKDKQLYMQIQLLNKKFKQQLSQVRSSSRNYQLSQAFNQLDSGLIIEGDMIFESVKNANNKQQASVLPKVVRFNMSMPVMGETVNVIEVTVRQNKMDQELLGALKIAQGAKFSSESVSKVVDSFKNSATKNSKKQQQQDGQGAPEADLSIKFENKNILYISTNDFKSTAATSAAIKRDTRSIHGIQQQSTIGQLVEELVQHLKRQPIAFNRGINVNINERLAKMLDIDASMIAGLRFESRVGASSQSSDEFEITAEIEPRFALEAIVGPAKVSSKKLLQRLSTKTALGLRLRYKANELVDVQVDLPLTNMDLFTVESQLVERSSSNTGSYSYLPESIYGSEDIYAPEEDFVTARGHLFNTLSGEPSLAGGIRKMKRSIFESSSNSNLSQKFAKMMKGSSQGKFAHTIETGEEIVRATGLRTKLNVVVSPKDMSFFVQASSQKVEPSMQGYRVQVQRNQRTGDQQQYIVTLSTPGSRTDRTMQVRAITQCNNQRTVLKSDIQSNRVAATMQLELIHDGRQYAAKLEMASSRGKQWRHQFECGLQRSQQTQAGRYALSYKPYLSVQSSELSRPIQLQGVLSYQQQSPKSVISYELKCPTSGDFVQGKLVFEQRPSSAGKRASQFVRRSSKSPLMILVSQSEIVMTSELVSQLGEHAIKTHQMVDWSPSQLAFQSQFNCMHKNLRKNQEQQLTGSIKLSEQQQMLVAERRCPQMPRKDVRFALESQLKQEQAGQAGQHQLSAEARFANNQIVAYKQKVDYQRPSSKSVLVNYQVELMSSASKINERAQGRVQIDAEPMMKVVRAQMSAGQRSGELSVEYSSPVEHQIELSYQGEQYQHRCSVRASANKGKFEVESNTQKQGKKVNQLELHAYPSQQTVVFVFEQPGQQTHVAAELKFKQGEQSSVAVQTGRYTSKAELVISKINRRAFGKRSSVPSWMRPIWGHQYQFKGDLKDQNKQEAYLMESAFNGFEQEQPSSYLRFESPSMRSELEFEPRGYSTRMAAYGRQKRSVGFGKSLSSHNDLSTGSMLNTAFDTDKMDLSNKLWMVRSMISSPRVAQQLKQQARRALFEYADRRQQHKHSLDWNPSEQRLNFNFETQPGEQRTGSQSWWSPMRATGDLSTQMFGPDAGVRSQRPSSFELSTDFADTELVAQPFNGEEAYVRVNAKSRYPRSAFNKHESEIRYAKKSGAYKAWMKHQDKDDKRHNFDLEFDENPKKWAKMSYESAKLGKGQWEHQWRKHQASGKRTHQQQQQQQQQQHYLNKFNLDTQSPSGKWSHRTNFQWEEPMAVAGRVRRDTSTSFNNGRGETTTSFDSPAKYTTLDYLKHANARLQSQVSKDQRQLYNVDFDYQPQAGRTSLNVNMPEDMLHSSSLEYQPTERTYKVASRLYNERTKVPTYELIASTKPMYMDEQEQFEQLQQQQLQQNNQVQSYLASMLRQPMKMSYSDKFGRKANIDYDNSPMSSSLNEAGLRLKRAAVYYKDEPLGIEHDSSMDFYPINPCVIEKYLQDEENSRIVDSVEDISINTQTKYGSIKMRTNLKEDTIKVDIKSPVFDFNMLTPYEIRQWKISKPLKFYISNKNQSYKLAKIVRKSPIFNQVDLLHKIAKKLDEGLFEQQTEFIIGREFKLKSKTSYDQSPVVVVEGEFNKQENKAYFKIDGPRVNGQCVIDQTNRSINLQFDVDNKRTMHHYTRLVRVSDKFYSLDSATTYEQQPLVKITGKLSSKIFKEHGHYTNSNQNTRSGLNSPSEGHVSTFDATIYQSEPVQVSGAYDCVKNTVRVNLKNLKEKSESSVLVHFDQQDEKIYLEAEKVSPRGVDYKVQKTINLPEIHTVHSN